MDLAACQAVREAVGDDMVLMLDAGAAYCREEALRVGRELEKLSFYWYEEPLIDSDLEGYVQLARALDIPILGIETTPGPYTNAEYILRGAIDIGRGDVNVKGGITPLMKLVALCELFQMKCEIHGPGIPNLQVIGGIKNCDYYEDFIGLHSQYMSFGIKNWPTIDKDGYVHIPTLPGLGMEIDWEDLGEPIATA